MSSQGYMIDDTNTKELPPAFIIVSKQTIAMIKIETITYIFCRKMANNKKNEVSISVLQFCTIIYTGIYMNKSLIFDASL